MQLSTWFIQSEPRLGPACGEAGTSVGKKLKEGLAGYFWQQLVTWKSISSNGASFISQQPAGPRWCRWHCGPLCRFKTGCLAFGVCFKEWWIRWRFWFKPFMSGYLCWDMMVQCVTLCWNAVGFKPPCLPESCNSLTYLIHELCCFDWYPAVEKAILFQ